MLEVSHSATRVDSVRLRTFSIKSPRNPLLRALLSICGAVIAAAILLSGLLLGAALLVATAATLLLRRWFHRRQRRPMDPDIIEGEYTVVPRSRAALPHS